MTGLYIFGAFLAAIIAVFIVFKIRWNRADRALEQQQQIALEAEIADEQARRQVKTNNF